MAQYNKTGITVNTNEWRKSANAFINSRYPDAVARGFKKIAESAQEEIQKETKGKFALHTDYILRGIRSTPRTPGQLKASARAVDKYGNMEAAVYLRPGSGRKDLSFMVDHETGASRKPRGKRIAIPAGGLDNYNYQTKTGGVRKRWRPSTLLQKWNTQGPNRAGNDLPPGKRRGKPAPFIIETSSGTMLARRKTRKDNSLEFLYSFNKSANIKQRWGFEATINADVARNYRPIMNRFINKIK